MPVDADALERLHKLRSLGVRQGVSGLGRAGHQEPALAPQAEQAQGAAHDAGPGGAGAGLPGEAVATPHGPAWVQTVRYPLAERPDLGSLLAVPREALAALGHDPALFALDPAATAFIDVETTGLALDAGTYTFLIGIGTFEDDFVVRQYFMRSPAEERAQLHLVSEALGCCTGIVSFNGRAFDLPLLQNRFLLARLAPPLPGAPHLDLLPPARRLWRAHLGSCALGELERKVLGRLRSAADVPGWMIPGIYHDFYQGGGGEATHLMTRVFYHNQEDITSMASLATHMARFFERAQAARCVEGLHPLECASLARCYDSLGWAEASEAAYRAALAGPPGVEGEAEMLRAFGFWLKRAGRREEAAALWETWITTVRDADLTPYLELAKHHEWHTGDIRSARSWAAWAASIVESGWPPGAARNEALADLRRRLQRLERKLAGGRATSEHGQAIGT